MIARELVDLSVPCRVYPSRDREYPRKRFGGRLTRVHRIAFLTEKGPLAADETVDHLCFNRHCWEPLHLEAVSAAENVRRSWRANRGAHRAAVEPGVSRCVRGHEPNWRRQTRAWQCRECHREQAKASNRRLGLVSI